MTEKKQDTKTEEKKEKTKTPEEHRQEHTTKYNIFRRKVDSYKQPETVTGTNAKEKYDAIDKKMEVMGINLTNVPELCQPLYVAVYNAVFPPERRYKSATEKLSGEHQTLDDAVKKSTDCIFNKKNGLNREISQLELNLVKNSYLAKELDEEINNTDLRIKETEKNIGTQFGTGNLNSLETITKLHEDLSTYEENLLEYDDIRRTLDIEFEDADLRIKIYSGEKTNLMTMRNYLVDQKNIVERAMKSASLESKRNQYEEIFRTLPTTQDRLDVVKGMIEAKRDVAYERLNVTADLTRRGLQFGITADERGNPLQEYEKVHEERTDRIKQRREEILSKYKK